MEIDNLKPFEIMKSETEKQMLTKEIERLKESFKN